MITYGSCCSGVEAATLAWEPLGWKPRFFAEVEPFPAAVLCHRFGATRPLRPLDPAEADTEKDCKLRESWQKQIAELPPYGTIPNLGDFTKIRNDDYDGTIDLLVGGTPCQSYSVAGLRKGLADPRGNLALEFVKLAYRSNARWTVWENVPGVLSSNKGCDFAGFLSLLCGWEVPVPRKGWQKSGIVTPVPGCFGLAWRILDAQYTRTPEYPRAVPQRRRRLFVIGYLGRWEYPAQVLLDGEMRDGNPPPRRTKRTGVAHSLTASTGGVSAKEQQTTFVGASGEPLNALCMAHGQANAEISEENAPTLSCNHEAPVVSFYPQRKVESISPATDVSNTLTNGTCPGFTNAICYDARGNGNGETTNTIAGNHAGHASDFMPVIVFTANDNGRDCMEECSPTLRKGGETPADGGAIVPAVVETEPLAFIKNDAGGDQQGYWRGVFPTLRTEITPAIAYSLSFCDANGRRKDRPNGGLYITEADTGKTITAAGPNTEMIVLDPLETPVALDGDKMAKAERKGGSGLGVSQDGVMYTQTAKDVHAVAYHECVPLDLRNATRDPDKCDAVNRQGVGVGSAGDPMTTLSASHVPGVGYRATVRRLLPIECERLMGFEDNHTLIPWKGKPESECPDSARYKACGNSMCVNVMQWLGYRIQMVENEIQKRKPYA